MVKNSFFHPLALSLLLSTSITASAEELEVKASAAELFTGELKRLEPHLDLMTHGCVKLECSQRIDLTMALELWENGKKRLLSSVGGVSEKGTSEISLSFRETTSKTGKAQYTCILSHPQLGSRTSFDKPEIVSTAAEGLMSHRMNLKEPILIPEEKGKAVWGYRMTKANKAEPWMSEIVEEALPQAETAIVLRLTWSKLKKR